jgi:hypothetical protein
MGPAMNTINAKLSTRAMKSKVAASKKKKTMRKTAKLKSSKWYQGAARSIGITKERPV